MIDLLVFDVLVFGFVVICGVVIVENLRRSSRW